MKVIPLNENSGPNTHARTYTHASTCNTSRSMSSFNVLLWKLENMAHVYSKICRSFQTCSIYSDNYRRPSLLTPDLCIGALSLIPLRISLFVLLSQTNHWAGRHTPHRTLKLEQFTHHGGIGGHCMSIIGFGRPRIDDFQFFRVFSFSRRTPQLKSGQVQYREIGRTKSDRIN